MKTWTVSLVRSNKRSGSPAVFAVGPVCLGCTLDYVSIVLLTGGGQPVQCSSVPTQKQMDAFTGKTSLSARSSRRRAVGLDILIVFASIPAAYFRVWERTGEMPDVDQFYGMLLRTVPLSFICILVRRFAHAKRRGNANQYDYVRMNPIGKFSTLDVVSPVPYVHWERHRGEMAFFDNIIDSARFIDTPGLALHVAYKGTPDETLETLASLRKAALHWDLVATEQGGYTVHAIFDIPPPLANKWTSDHGARMWLSINTGDAPGSSDVRAVFGVGGFGQGQPAALAPELLPVNWFPVGVADWAFKVEANLRGAVSWWMLTGRALGVDEKEFSALHGGRLAKKVFTGMTQSVVNRKIGKVVLMTVLGCIVFFVILPLLFSALMEVARIVIN